jgi:hypothetical protein
LVESVRPEGASSRSEESSSIPPLLFGIGILITVLLGGYAISYTLSVSALRRYDTGFVIRRCPVCEAGKLQMEERPYRILGIPKVRRAVRCDRCRSVLREVGKQRWRYAIDPVENQTLYQNLNNRIVGEQTLVELAAGKDEDDMPHYIG